MYKLISEAEAVGKTVETVLIYGDHIKIDFTDETAVELRHMSNREAQLTAALEELVKGEDHEGPCNDVLPVPNYCSHCWEAADERDTAARQALNENKD